MTKAEIFFYKSCGEVPALWQESLPREGGAPHRKVSGEMSHSGHEAQNPVIVKDVNLIVHGQR